MLVHTGHEVDGLSALGTYVLTVYAIAALVVVGPIVAILVLALRRKKPVPAVPMPAGGPYREAAIVIERPPPRPCPTCGAVAPTHRSPPGLSIRELRALRRR